VTTARHARGSVSNDVRPTGRTRALGARQPDTGGPLRLGKNARVPASAADRRLLVFTSVIVLFAGLAVAAVLFFATGGGKDTPKAKPLFVGLETQLRRNIRDQGPQYIANPFAGNGFWLDVEGNRIVAYSLVLPGTDHCIVKWKAQRGSYVDCNGDAVDRADLDRFKVAYRSHEEGRDRDVLVDLRVLEPAPGSNSGG